MAAYRSRHKVLVGSIGGLVALGILAAGSWPTDAQRNPSLERDSDFLRFSAPAGDRPATANTIIDGLSAAVLPNGRLVTPAGTEVNVQAPKPFGLALSPDGAMLATLNSGAAPFSLTLISQLSSATPAVKRIDVNASFMGVTFSADSRRVYLRVARTVTSGSGTRRSGTIIGSVNLNGPAHPLDRPLDVVATPAQRFKGAFPGNMVLSRDGRFLYVVDQGASRSTSSSLQDRDRRRRAGTRHRAGQFRRGGRPASRSVAIHSASRLSPDDRTLFVTHVGVFQYTHLRPANPTGDDNVDYPLCYPGAGYPAETRQDREIEIKKVDPRNLPDDLRDPDGIRCGYVPSDTDYTVPGLGSPNAPESSSVYVLMSAIRERGRWSRARVRRELGRSWSAIARPTGLDCYSGSHPNAVVVGRHAIYVANGNNDSISMLDPRTYQERQRIGLSPLRGADRTLRGVQPVGLALSPDGRISCTWRRRASTRRRHQAARDDAGG